MKKEDYIDNFLNGKNAIIEENNEETNKDIKEDKEIDEIEVINDIIDKEEYDSNKVVNIINLLYIYYKRINEMKTINNIFSNINSKLDTNEELEFIFHYINKYKKDKEENNYNNLTIKYEKDNNININEYEELYALVYNSSIDMYCGSIMPLILYINEKENEGNEIIWDILKIK